MKSLRELLIVGPGPSSSHTIAPYRISKAFLNENQDKGILKFEITLMGSLSLTGKGHSTDNIIKEALKPFECDVFFVDSFEGLSHPNTMECRCLLKDGSIIKKRYLSIGGGSFVEEGEELQAKEVYPFDSFDAMRDHMWRFSVNDIFSLIEEFEDEAIFEYGEELLTLSFHTIEDSLKKSDTLPGPLKLKSVAKKVYERSKSCKDAAEKRILSIAAYAYATSEANARGDKIVTTPTCGASGVVPAVLYYEFKHHHYSMKNLTRAFLVGALVCDFIKTNASVSGALLGCQSEVGSATSFATASLCYLHSLNSYQIEYGAEVAMEHFLGLTCDPVDGYVQIPCIERNAMAAIHAYSAYLFSKDISLSRRNKVSFDNVIKAMNETGKELPNDLKETSLGGLAKVVSC